MILHFLITVLFIYGIHASTRDGMIFSDAYFRLFYFISRWTSKPERVLKPLFDCTPCMASFYGTISFFIAFPPSALAITNHWAFVMMWVIWVFALSGFNYILNKLLNR